MRIRIMIGLRFPGGLLFFPRLGRGTGIPCFTYLGYPSDSAAILLRISAISAFRLESVYIKTQNPVLCKQKDFIFSLGIFK